MAVSNTKATKRLSSLFSLIKDDSASNPSQSSAFSQYNVSSKDLTPSSRPQSPTLQHLSKHRVTSSASYGPSPIDTSLRPLNPPPCFTADGVAKTQSRDSSKSRHASRTGSPTSSREGSRSRPQTPSMLAPPGSGSRPVTPDSVKLTKRRSWLPGKSPKSVVDRVHSDPKAWIAGLREHIPYNLQPLLNGQKSSEIWNDQGDTIVHLFPRDSGRGPSFKIDSQLCAASRTLMQLLEPSVVDETEWRGRSPDFSSLKANLQSMSIQVPQPAYGFPSQRSSLFDTSTNYSMSKSRTAQGPRGSQLYLPLGLDGDYSHEDVQPCGDDLELLVLYRNFFAFLTGGALISTPRQVSLYSVFLGIGSILRRYNFSSIDDSTYGQVAAASFTRYCDELRLADVRSSREKTIEAIVLGEHMKSWPLYNEGFVHAAGRLEDIKSIKSPKFLKISPVTANRLERATIDIEARLLTVRTRLEDFDFPSMFSGVANSQTSNESRIVRFKEWKLAFMTFRRHVVSHYRRRFGAWPPKAKSKKHNFEESGLNRLVLKELYQDFCDLYEMLADRTAMTTRTTQLAALSNDAESEDLTASMQHALRRVEDEYDRSDVPVRPPIPFDVPLLPTFMQSFNRSHNELPNDSTSSTRRLKDNEVNEILLGSYNRESMKATPWIQDFIAFERRMGQGKTLDEIVDMRTGQWLFVYAVLQSLPMVAVDARDLKFTDGVEYFLCIPSRGGRPWMKEDTSQSRAWYNVASGGAVVSLPADQVDHSVEGIYRRSHCWTVASTWASRPGLPSPEPDIHPSKALQAPTYVGGLPPNPSPQLSPYVSPTLRPDSPSLDRPSSRGSYRSSVALGLEAVAAPPERASRPASVLNPNMTFDTILGPPQTQRKKGKK